ncbi:MAG: hypothetical protein JNJ99_16535 [Crocinitomicaceae bacterium]|nr:hypothetical protein [Crocinitomicaceae bacterium]
MTQLSNVIPFPGAEKNKSYLILISPESIPHLGLIHAGLYYSLTYKECENAKDFGIYLATLVKAKRKLLFIELDGLEQNPWNVFPKFEKLAGTELTCLQPVKECIMPNSKAEYVFELVRDLQNSGRVKQVYQMNMDADFKDQDHFNLREYTRDSIYTYIKALNEKHAKRR